MKSNEDKNLDVYLRAKHRMERLKKFYKHLVVFIIVLLIVTLFKVKRNLNHGETFKEAIFDIEYGAIWMIWSIFLVFHAISVFGIPLLVGKHWEELKIKEYMEKEQSQEWK